MPDKPRAYSYLRFSTPEQLKGDSLRRQRSMAEEYADRHGLTLDKELTFQDLGVSAFRGQNAENGHLMEFLEAVRVGLVPQGSLLLVEQLDRISRQAARRALRVLEDIVEAGVGVVTLNDGRLYTQEALDSDPMSLILAILTFIRANEESATKARRLKQSWEAKRANVGSRALTSIAPAWLRLDTKTGAFEVIADRAALVQRIFRMTLDGVGQHSIAATINREGVAPWGRGTQWHRSYIAKVLSNASVMGQMTPHTVEYQENRRSRKPLEPVEGYYPAIVDPETFAAVQSLSKGTAAPRGRHAAAPITNVLASLASCPLCGGTFTRVNKGRRGGTSLVCAAAKSGAGCSYVSIPYPIVESAILSQLPARLDVVPLAGDSSGLEAQILTAEEALDALSERIAVTVDNLSRERSPALSSSLRNLEAEHEEAKAKRDALLDQRAAASGPLIAKKVGVLREALAAKPLDAAAVNLALRSVFARAVVNYPDGLIDFRWMHGGETSLPFAMPRTLRGA